MPFYPFLGQGSPTKIDYRKNQIGYYGYGYQLILTSLLEDLDAAALGMLQQATAEVLKTMAEGICPGSCAQSWREVPPSLHWHRTTG